MDPRSGFTCPNLLEADTDRALIEAGRRLVVVADHSKWGVIGISSIARLDQADVLITDAGIGPEARVDPGRRGPRAASSSSRPPSTQVRGRSRRMPTDASRRAGRLARRSPAWPASPHRRYNPLIDEWVLVSAGRTRRPWLGAEEPDAGADRPGVRPGLLPLPGQRPGERRRQPGLRRDVRLHQRLRGAAAGHRRSATFDDGLLRAEGERGLVPGRLLLAAPRPDPRARWRPTPSGASSTCGPSRPPSSAPSTAGSRSSRTGARRWAPRTRIRTARSGPARRCPGDGAREDAAQRAHLAATGQPAAARLRRPGVRRAAGRRRDRRVAGRSCRSGRPGRSRRCSCPKRPAARLTDLDDAARDDLAVVLHELHRPLRRAVQAAVPVLDGLAPGAVRRRRRPTTGRSTPTSIRRCCAPTCASSWSATSCSPRPSAT